MALESEPTRGIIVDHSGVPGGGQLGMARYLRQRGTGGAHMTGVVLGAGPAFDSLDPGIVVRLGNSTSKWGFLRAIWRLRSYLRTANPDVLIANSAKAALAVRIAANRRAVRIYYVRSDIDSARMSRLKYRFTTSFVLPGFHAFLSNSNWTRSTIPSSSLAKPNAVAYPVSGLAAAGEPVIPSSNERGVRVVSLSRIARWKGTDILLDALAILNEEGVGHLFALDLAGEAHHEDGFFADRIRERVANEFPNVRLRGHLDDVQPLLTTADALVLASVTPEPFGQVVVQGMAAGLLVIATDLGGPAEVITDGVDGRLTRPSDPAAVADALRGILTSPREARSMRNNAVHTSAKYFDDKTVPALDKAILDLYEQARGESRSAR